MILYNLFPTPVLRVPADPDTYDSIQIEIRDAIHKIEEEQTYSDVTYLYKKNNLSLSNKTYNFISNFNCDKLKDRIKYAAIEYIKQIKWGGQWVQDDLLINIKNSWLNIIESGDNHGQHCHPGYSISGVYYYRIEPSMGSISFNNPNPLMFSCSFPQGHSSPQHSFISPNRGDIILFPSWLVHSTIKNKTEEDRISVAFNIDLENLVSENVYGLVKGTHMPFIKYE